MKKLTTTAALLGLLLFADLALANEKTIRATEINSTLWSDLWQKKINNIIIEFRQGDELPVTFEAKGDLIATTQSSVSYIGIKKNFWLRFQTNTVEISLDGITYKKINELLTGSLSAEGNSNQNNGVANSINIIFSAFLK